jgi:hypothetical protein
MAAGKIIHFLNRGQRDYSFDLDELVYRCRRLADQCYGLSAVAYDVALATELQRWGDQWTARASELERAQREAASRPGPVTNVRWRSRAKQENQAQ